MRSRIARAQRRHHRRRYHIGPASWLDRLREAAFDGHVCQLITVEEEPANGD